MSIPRKDSLLVAYALNFGTRLLASPATYFTSEAEAEALAAVCETYRAAQRTLADQHEAGIRSEPQRVERDDAKAAMLRAMRARYAMIGNNPAISDAAKIAIGVHVRAAHRSRSTPPTQRPRIGVTGVHGQTITLFIRDDTAGAARRASGAVFAFVHTFVGENPPADLSDWRFAGAAPTTRHAVTLPHSTPPGARVWIGATWVNRLGDTGPMSNAVATNIQGGGVNFAALRQAA